LGGSVIADSYDGLNARWLLTNVKCIPSDGPITVTVTADGTDSKSATITADNTDPELRIIQPEKGLYLFNMRLIRFSRIIIFGSITIELDTGDNTGISRAEYFIDDSLKTTIFEEPFEWRMRQRLMGKHTIQVSVYDLAGNTASESITATIYNLFGSR
jgi:hypothetical protein